MTVKDLAKRWENQAQGKLTKSAYQVRLGLEDAAKIDALAEMFPRRNKEQLISELMSAALKELESSFPYRQDSQVVSEDEEGYPIYADAGPTPAFLKLTKKYLSHHKAMLDENSHTQ